VHSTIHSTGRGLRTSSCAHLVWVFRASWGCKLLDTYPKTAKLKLEHAKCLLTCASDMVAVSSVHGRGNQSA
jgi:hypothetical protein